MANPLAKYKTPKFRRKRRLTEDIRGLQQELTQKTEKPNPLAKYKTKQINPLAKYLPQEKQRVEVKEPQIQPERESFLPKVADVLTPDLRTIADIATLGQVTALEKFGEARKATRRIVTDLREKVFGVRTFKGKLPSVPQKARDIALSPFKGVKGLQGQIEAVNTKIAEDLADMATDVEFWGFIGLSAVTPKIIQSFDKAKVTQDAVNNARKIIKVPAGASPKQIKSAYLKMNLRGKYSHPDRGGSSDLNAQLHEAFETLSKNQSYNKTAGFMNKFRQWATKKKVNLNNPVELEKALTEFKPLKPVRVLPKPIITKKPVVKLVTKPEIKLVPKPEIKPTPKPEVKPIPKIEPKPVEIPKRELVGETDIPVGMSAEFLKPKTISESKETIKKLIRTKYGEEQEALLDSFAFRTKMKQELSTVEREAMPFLLEKTPKVPRVLQRDDIQRLVKNPTKKMKSNEIKIRKYLDEGHKYIMEQTGDDVGFIENYVTHIWDIPKNKIRETVNWFTKLNPTTKKRFISTYAQGIIKGLKPKTLDINKILATYDRYKATVSANIKFANHLVNMKDETGMNLVQRFDKAPDNWITIDHYAFRRAKLIGVAGEKPILMKFPVKVHPDIADELKVILDKPFDSKGLRALTTINAYLKKAQLTFSLFHHIALTETAFATPKMLKSTIQMWNPKKIYDALVKGDYVTIKKLDVAKDGVKHGLQLGSISDVQRGRVQKSIDDLAEKTKDIPFLRKATSGISKANELWDRGLWDYYHNGLKINAYENLMEWTMKKSPTVNVDKAKEEVAQFVNDTFGGQSWELLLKNPKWVQSMHLILLSPDWTYSTIRQALSPFGVGAVHDETKFLRKKMGRGFWIRAMLYFWGTLNLLNYGLTKRKTGKGKYMWDNDPGHKTHLFLGFNRDGTKKYLRWGKQFRELPEAIKDPVKKISGKLSPLIHVSVVQATGRTVSGFKTEIADKTFYDSLPDRLIELLKAPIPFSFKQMLRNGEIQPLGIAMPISRGMTPFTTRRHFTRAIKQENKDYVIEVGIAATENNLDARRIYVNTINGLLADKRYDLRRKYKVRSFQDLPREGMKEYREYKNKLKTFERQMIRQIPRKKRR